MTNEYRKTPIQPPVHPDNEDVLEAIDEALQELVRIGQIVDSGKRRWSERTGRYEIVWRSRHGGPEGP